MSDARGLVFPRSVASLDIETLALDNRAVVTEVGIVTGTLVLREAGRVELLDTPLEWPAKFNALDQIARGRVMSPETWRFHLKHSGTSGLYDQVAQGLLLNDEGTKGSLEYIQKVLSGISEVWVNGLSFDPVILSTLAQDYGFETRFAMSRLWHYSKERDIRTLNKTIPGLDTSKVKSSHRAMDDAKWNLQLVVNYYSLLNRMFAIPDAGNPEENGAPA